MVSRRDSTARDGAYSTIASSRQSLFPAPSVIHHGEVSMALLKIARMGHPVLLQRAEAVADPGRAGDPPPGRRHDRNHGGRVGRRAGRPPGACAVAPVRVPGAAGPRRVAGGRAGAHDRAHQPGDRGGGRRTGHSLGGLPVDPRTARRRAASCAHPLPWRRLRRPDGAGGGRRLPRRRGAARVSTT